MNRIYQLGADPAPVVELPALPVDTLQTILLGAAGVLLLAAVIPSARKSVRTYKASRKRKRAEKLERGIAALRARYA